MNADVLATRVADGIAVVTLGSAGCIYFDEEMGDALTAALDKFAGDPNIRVVIVTGGAPGYFNRHFSIPALIWHSNETSSSNYASVSQRSRACVPSRSVEVYGG
jgi:enoyl-CoA hydratase/carnithine racemase